MAEISQFISSLGFPIFVAVYMLIKGSKESANIEKALIDLKLAIDKLSCKKE